MLIILFMTDEMMPITMDIKPSMITMKNPVFFIFISK